MTERKLIVGCGYLGTYVGRLWRQQGHDVTGITRSGSRSEQLAQAGIRSLVCDIAAAPICLPAVSYDSVLFAVGTAVDEQRSECYLVGIERLTSVLVPPPRRFLFVSSAGVYDDSDGWIDEESPCHPRRASSRLCWQAEQWLASSTLWQRTIVLRLAGLYGPGRIPRLDALRRGQSIIAAADAWMNVVRVEDAAAVIVAADRWAPAPRIYNVSDGTPVQRRDFFSEIAKQFHTPPPQFVEPSSYDARQQRSCSNKKLDISRLKREIPVQFQFPDYKAGLADLARQPKSGSIGQ